MSNIVSKEVTATAIKALQNSFRSNWVNSVELIYTFAKTYSNTSLEQALTKRGFTITKKANAFTCSAKLAVMEEDANGKCVVSEAQASRYSKVCMYLNKHKVEVGDVDNFLKDKSLNSIICASKNPVNEKELKELLFAGLFEIQKEFQKVVVKKKDINIKNLGAEPGANLMVVITDDDGNITAMTVASNSPKYEAIANDILRSKAPKADGTNSAEDAIEAATIEAKAA
ncbi:hypothetical protein [Magnetovibrio blakemorei]|uniref:Uncharacterized protein n=1 Tax=Magnetovibrio blakemorei TaxID=28181 RepID=A0A1E5Q4Q0_9PROT|nr:hypothetical protein [Magnetovibrio blakemorei]OEJ65194.1 hypothetical protein BEN30_15085 [Magnetovibrio blakemorei]